MQQDLLPRQMQPARCAWLPKETPRGCRPLMTQWTTAATLHIGTPWQRGTHMREQLILRCTWRGLDHFKAYVWSSVVAYSRVLFTRLKPS